MMFTRSVFAASLLLAQQLLLSVMVSGEGGALPRDVLTEYNHHDLVHYPGPKITTEAAKTYIEVTKLYLVDVVTGKDITELTNGTIYDVTKIKNGITIRAETSDPDGCGIVIFDLDNGLTLSKILNSPFTLAGNNTEGVFAASATLREGGEHIIKVTPSVDGDLIEKPIDLQERPVEVDRPSTFKSCWNIQRFASSTPIVIKTESYVDEKSALAGIIEDRSSAVEFSTGRFSSLLPGNRRREEEKKLDINDHTSVNNYWRRRVEVVTDDSFEDGSLTVVFYVKNTTDAVVIPPPPPPSYDVAPYPSTIFGSTSGSFFVNHKVTLGFVGPATSEITSSERGPYEPLTSFKDFRADVTFEHFGKQASYTVPAYFALDGDAANSLGKSEDGSVWLAHFVPPIGGDWKWTVSFRYGTNCSPNGGGDPAGYFDGQTGVFLVDELANAQVPPVDFINKGRIKVHGVENTFTASSAVPNILAYNGFDATFTKTPFNTYPESYVTGNPTYNLGNGTGIIGTINKLASEGVSVIEATAITSDGDSVAINPFNKVTMSLVNYDCSKLSQWKVALEWAERNGMATIFQFQDFDSDTLLDGGATNEARKTFYREMVARLGHNLGIIYHIGEDLTQSQIDDRTAFLSAVDPYDTPIIYTQFGSETGSIYADPLGSTHPIGCINIMKDGVVAKKFC